MDGLIRHLRDLGLADNEARCYAALQLHGAMSGYEVARRSGVARGNVYPPLERLLSKGAAVRTDDDLFVAVALEQFAASRQADLREAGSRAAAELRRLGGAGEHAQVLSVRGGEAVLARARSIVAGADAPVFVAAFPEELGALAPELGEAAGRGVAVEALSYGPAPGVLAGDASDEGTSRRAVVVLEHAGAGDIERAQGGRLLMVAAWPQGLIAVLGGADGAAGAWAWNRYVASAVGLYVAHERFLVRAWAALPGHVRRSLEADLTDLSSRIALAGLVPGAPLLEALRGSITPPAAPSATRPPGSGGDPR